MDPPSGIFVLGGISDGARPFPLKIFDKKFQSTQPLENASTISDLLKNEKF